MPSRAPPPPSSQRSSAPIPTWSACRWRRPAISWPVSATGPDPGMAAELIVSALPGEIRAAVRRDGVLQDLAILRAGLPGKAAAPHAADPYTRRASVRGKEGQE